MLLAADILLTAVAPTWDEIAKLAAIATIRTALNYFLQKEIEAHTRLHGLPNETEQLSSALPGA